MCGALLPFEFKANKGAMSKFLALEEALKSNGWTVENLPLESECWWAKEVWCLVSEWSPLEQRVYLSLLLDPQCDFDDITPSDAEVWAIDLSFEVPASRPLGGISVNRHFSSRFD